MQGLSKAFVVKSWSPKSVQLLGPCANRCSCKKKMVSPGICVLVRRCRCLMPLKEINERTTNREGGQRRRDEREATGERADGEEGWSDGRWECVCVAWRDLHEVHSWPAEWNSFSPLCFFFFLFFFKYSHSLSGQVSPSTSYSLVFFFLQSLMVCIPLLRHIPPVRPVMASRLWCHSEQ